MFCARELAGSRTMSATSFFRAGHIPARAAGTLRPALETVAGDGAEPDARPDGGEACAIRAMLAVGDFLAAIHHHHAVDLPLQFRQRVRRQQHHGAVAAQFAQDFVEVLSRGGVEAGGGFVEQQGARCAEQSLGEAEALPHALGIGFRRAGPPPPPDADAIEQRRIACGRGA